MADKVKPVFESQFAKHDRISKNVGDGMRDLYTSRIDDDGNVELIKSGQEDLYAAIQSHKDSCDIHILLARYANGDEMALSKVQGVYGDFTQMPKTYAELLNTVIAGENLFNSLPKEVREKFDHSLEKFMIAMDDMPSFLQKIGGDPAPVDPAPVDPAPVVKKEVEKDVS